MKLAVIDICGTLFDSNTTFDFIKWYLHRQNKNRDRLFSLMRMLPVKALNKCSIQFLKLDVVRIILIRLLNGLDKVFLKEEAKAFYQEFLLSRKRSEILSIVETLREQGYDLILVSATLDFIAEEIAEKLNIRQFFSTTLYYKDGICSGKIKEDLLGRKEIILTSIMKQYKEVLTITDNKSDLSLINQSSHSYIISLRKDVHYWEQRLKENFKMFIYE
ncbi:HAD-IB family phosphatase [Chitinophaga oryziterrae]|uniref:HAD-IB family phosphatase n=1 Tax=Chitinophaga oryziterrae TaxID=1031224 RepID=A0A6N8JFN2_9BACT|nr:HAD-IB family phosphatase [Chitinophaga oryziterrae]MVT44063.1 HAD-IB family phosphatase [Chitinophaga oryziterrae]